MDRNKLVDSFVANACEVAGRKYGSMLAWARANPLKISGILGVVGSTLLALAGKFTLDNYAVTFGGIMEVMAYLTTILWGRGGPEETNSEAPKVDVRTLFSIQKCLFAWRYPAESSTFQIALGGIGYFGGGIESAVAHNAVSLREAALMAIGCLVGVAGYYVNCVPERVGQISPMVKAACIYGCGSVLLATTAYLEQSGLLAGAASAFALSDTALGFSIRHENKPKIRTSSTEPA